MNAMRFRIRMACGAFLLVLFAPFAVSVAGAAPPPVSAFGGLPQITNVQINPKGNLLAWSDSSGAEPTVVIFDLETRKEKRRIATDTKLRGLDWSDDETLLIHLSVTNERSRYLRKQYEWYRTLAVDATSGSTRMLLMADRERSWVTGADLLALRAPKPKTVIMAAWDYLDTKRSRTIDSRLVGGRRDAGWINCLFAVDTVTGEGKLIDVGSYQTQQWQLDRQGQSLVRAEWNTEHSDYSLLARDGAGWKEIYRQKHGDATLHGLTADGSAVLMLAANGQPLSKLWTVPLDGSGAKVLFEDSRYDVEGVVYDSYSWEPIGARIGGPEPRVHWFDATAEARYNALSRSFAGRDVSIYGRNAEGTRVIVGVGAHAAPTTYYLVDFSKGTADIVGEEYPALAGVTLGEVRTISYKARDGYEIPAYITLPPGVAAEKLPLVVMPHGGPESRDEPDFDPFAQFLATRGYAVLQPQFRGSTGFGEAHRQAGVRQWGGLMQDDVTDGVKALIEQGLADPRRVCIVGMSYGGYAALAGAAFTPDLYACAASVSGVSDLPAMLGHVQRKSGKDSDQLAYWNGHIGEASDRRVIDKSPARAAANVRVPILLVHGVDDVVVPLSQSETMARALKDAGKSFRLVKMTGEDHWLSRSETRLTVMEELETFLAANLAVRSP